VEGEIIRNLNVFGVTFCFACNALKLTADEVLGTPFGISFRSTREFVDSTGGVSAGDVPSLDVPEEERDTLESVISLVSSSLISCGVDIGLLSFLKITIRFVSISGAFD
jgi:hypothetical protein